MAVRKATNTSSSGPGTQLVNLVITLILWTYFIFGFLFFFILFYLLAYLFSKDRELAFQRLHHLFYRGFFILVKAVIPRHSWQNDKDISKIRASVIICNHVSYLDPLIMISLFERHKTIVKTRFFHVPIFGWFMKTAGYLPSTTDEKFSYLMIKQVEQMKEYLRQGGNLIIFPEGTRNNAGKIGPLNNGALKIARLCQAPIKVLRIHNSDKLFAPGKFLFNTQTKNKIRVEFVDSINPDYQGSMPSVSELENLVQQSFATGN